MNPRARRRQIQQRQKGRVKRAATATRYAAAQGAPKKQAGPRVLAPFEERLRERVGEFSELREKDVELAKLMRLHSEARRSAVAGIVFVSMLLQTHRAGDSLVFIGRSARPLYAMAKRLLPYYGTNPKDVHVIDVSTMLIRQADSDEHTYRDLKTYLTQTLGDGRNRRARLVDTMKFTNHTAKLIGRALRDTGFQEVSTRTLYDAVPSSREASELLHMLEDSAGEGHVHAVEPVAELQRSGSELRERVLPVYRRASDKNKLRAWTAHQALQDATQNAIESLEAARAAAGRPPVPKPPWKR